MTSPIEKFQKQLAQSQTLIAAQLESLKGKELMEALTKLNELEKWSSWQFPPDSAGSGVIGKGSLRMSRRPRR